MPRTVVKVGGSLFDLPDLASRLSSFLAGLAEPEITLIPGGGATTDLIRVFDQRFHLGEERAHWLALHALTLNAHVLASLLPEAVVVDNKEDLQMCWTEGKLPILDAYSLLRQLEAASTPTVPHLWEAASDSVAAFLAKTVSAKRLILLKSIDFPPDINWHEAGRRGLVDPLFAEILKGFEKSLEVQVLSLR